MAKIRTAKTKQTVRTMDDLLSRAGAMPKKFSSGDVVEGVVVSIDNKEIMVDIGAKSEGVVSADELKSSEGGEKEFKVGDKIYASIVQIEDARGSLVLSIKKAGKEKSWRKLYACYKEGTPFKVIVIEYNKGGILVDAFDLRGFVPISHLSKAHFAKFNKATSSGGLAEINKNLLSVLDKELKVKIIEIDRGQNRIVLSEKELESKKIEKETKERLKKIKISDTLSGSVIAILPFGLLVDCGGVDGLVHISEISWEKLGNLDTLFKVGDPVKVKVIGIDEKEGKLGLSIKALKDNPWDKIAEKYTPGAMVTGRVSKIMPFGAFVELAPGVEGLIHISETVGPLKVGEKVKVVVVSIDVESQKLALSIRKIEESKIYK